MGCDIHTTIEVKIDNVWTAHDKPRKVFDWRAYGMFAFLAGVRNYAEVPQLKPSAEWPSDIAPSTKENLEVGLGDAHSHTWYLLSELMAFDYDKTFEDRRVARTYGNLTSGACTAEPGGGQVTSFRDYLSRGFFDDLDYLKSLGEPSDVRVLMFFDN